MAQDRVSLRLLGNSPAEVSIKDFRSHRCIILEKACSRYYLRTGGSGASLAGISDRGLKDNSG
jgi:hypothetical protein